MLEPDTFAAYLTLQGLADASIRNYRAMYCRYLDYCVTVGRDPHAPDPLTVRAFAAQLHGGRSLTAHARATVKHLCAACEVDDVSAAIPLPRQPRQHKPALAHADAIKLAQVARRSGQAGLAVLASLYTASRRSETASMMWRNIDWQNQTITLIRPKVRDLHTVPLHPRLAEVLLPRRVEGERWLFPGRHGGHVAPARIWEWTVEVGEKAGLGRVTPHMLRRTALTEINDATKDLRAAQEIAGHSDPSVTVLYTRASEERMTAAISSLAY